MYSRRKRTPTDLSQQDKARAYKKAAVRHPHPDFQEDGVDCSASGEVWRKSAGALPLRWRLFMSAALGSNHCRSLWPFALFFFVAGYILVFIVTPRCLGIQRLWPAVPVVSLVGSYGGGNFSGQILSSLVFPTDSISKFGKWLFTPAIIAVSSFLSGKGVRVYRVHPFEKILSLEQVSLKLAKVDI